MNAYLDISDSNSLESLYDQLQDQNVSYEEALRMAGDHHTYQIRISALVFLGMIIAGLQIMEFPFMFQTPEVECQSPTGEWFDCVPNDTVCAYPIRPKSGSINSVIVTYQLYCSHHEYRIIGETSYMIASALGVLALAPIADKYGKRVVLLVSYIITCLSLLGSHFAPNWIIFLLLLVFSGLGRAPFIYYGFQLLVEVSNERFRSIGVLIMGVSFALGAAITGFCSTIINHNWEHFYFYFIAVPSVLGLPFVYFWADESPMSYFPRYEYDSARKALQKIAKINRFYLPYFRFTKENVHYENYVSDNEFITEKITKKHSAYSYLDLFRYKSLRLSAIGGSYLSFATYFIFYGQILALDVLARNPALVAIVTSLIEGLSCVASMRLLTNFTRRATMMISFSITTLAFFLFAMVRKEEVCDPGNNDCLFIFEWIGFIELCVGRFWIAMLMCTTFVYANELFPTVIRSRGSGLINFCGRIGSVIPSAVIYVCKMTNISPAFIFGAIAAPASLVVYFMKETKGIPLAHHIEEEEEEAELRRKNEEQQQGIRLNL